MRGMVEGAGGLHPKSRVAMRARTRDHCPINGKACLNFARHQRREKAFMGGAEVCERDL